MIVWFATGNLHKKEELAEILSAAPFPAGEGGRGPALSIDLKIPADAGLTFAPEETGKTFFENAFIKAEALFRLLEETRPPLYTPGEPIIADDSGICVDALDGRPGIFSARYGGTSAGGKITAAERNALLLSELAGIKGGKAPRSARFVCAMVLYYSPGRFFAAQESLEGELVAGADLARGSGGFGYDPILYIPEEGRTVAELSGEEKNRLSHRGKAGKVIARILAGN